jgi:hypothetical protein
MAASTGDTTSDIASPSRYQSTQAEDFSPLEGTASKVISAEKPEAAVASTDNADQAIMEKKTWRNALSFRKGKRPLLLNIRSAEWIIQLCVGYGVFVDLCSRWRLCRILALALTDVPYIRLLSFAQSMVSLLLSYLFAWKSWVMTMSNL